MPTGYTAGIIDGKIKTFPEFAKQCMRAFGAVIHMRDERMDAEYVQREPSTYHNEQLEKANALLLEAETLSDDEIVTKRKAQLETDKEYYIESVAKTNKNWEDLTKMLTEVESYNPPTSEHTGIKDFMKQQLTSTLEYDGSDRYAKEKLAEIEKQLKTLNADAIRKDMIKEAKKDIAYHTKELNEDIKRCEESNKWVQDFLKSIEK